METSMDKWLRMKEKYDEEEKRKQEETKIHLQHGFFGMKSLTTFLVVLLKLEMSNK
jgi:plasmid maintenance system antidote protein VapI